MKTITIPTRLGSFPVHFVDNFQFADEVLKIPHSVVIVGKNVNRLYKRLFRKLPQERLLVLPMEEQHKTLDTVMAIYKRLLPFSAKRNLTIISFGGGVNQDITGFVASTIYRGANWIYVPTTLLAMADSAIGLKTSINFKDYKNVIGTFYPPSAIFINVDFLDTLSAPDYASGIGEIVKFYLMKPDGLKNLDKSIRTIDTLRDTKDKALVRRVIEQSIRIKLGYMKGDEFDRGKRNLLNYGHELGHALESVSGFRIPHGTGVLIGMLFANYVSCERKWLDRSLFSYINERLLLPNILARRRALQKFYFQPTHIIDRMKKDKKRTSEGLVLVLPRKDLTLVKVGDLTIQEIAKGLTFARQTLKL
ncbi:hypothetical protein HY950_03300 [Candidatus Gottesmanbacteria bacterium]|nr:hypothetical protein [Candidatus Gottesmanbacteria bacterium]